MIRTPADASRAGLQLEVTCLGCGRVVVLQSSGFMSSPFYARDIALLAARLVCEGGLGDAAGCGRKGASVRAVTWPPTPPSAPRPRLLDMPEAPAGVDPDAWARADERMRRRMIKGARG